MYVTVNGFLQEWMCVNTGSAPLLPRLCVNLLHSSNVPANSPSSYYKRGITIPLLDHLLTEMKGRFRPSLNCITGFFSRFALI